MKKRHCYIILFFFTLLPFINLSAQTRIESSKTALPYLNNQEKTSLLNDIGFYYIDSDEDYDEDSSLKYSYLA